MSYSSSFDALPKEDVYLFKSMNIKIFYIPKTPGENFYRIMLDKFRILEFTQYDRVLYLDSDTLTLGSMDYLFHLSIQGKLKRNVVFVGNKEPASGSRFILAPNEGDYDRIVNVIREKELRGSKLPYPHWDEIVGWGHSMSLEHDDYFEDSRGNKRYLWNFYGAFGDQGLLYHWVRYEMKHVSVVYKHKVLNYGELPDGNTGILETLDLDIFNPPHSEFIHFFGQTKPWLAGPPDDMTKPQSSSSDLWFHILQNVSREFDFGIDLMNWKPRQKPLLGFFPKFSMGAETKYRSEMIIEAEVPSKSSQSGYESHINANLSTKISKVGAKLQSLLTSEDGKSTYKKLVEKSLLSQETVSNLSASDRSLMLNAIQKSTFVANDEAFVNEMKEKDVLSRYAIAYFIGKCDPDRRESYLNVIYNILVNTFVMRNEQSKADVVVFIQIEYRSKHDSLSADDIHLLEMMNIKYRYIPKHPMES